VSLPGLLKSALQTSVESDRKNQQEAMISANFLLGNVGQSLCGKSRNATTQKLTLLIFSLLLPDRETKFWQKAEINLKPAQKTALCLVH
jgi:hypothetical protein